MSNTILATFDHLNQAEKAVDALVKAGINRSDIGLAAHDKTQQGAQHTQGADVVNNRDDVTGSEGASTGAVFGTIVGAVVALGAIMIPGVGPIIAAGPLAAALGAAAGAGIGALSGGITGGVTASLIKFGVPEQDAHYYAETLRQGGALVSVTATEGETARATEILQGFNPVDIDQRVTQWRAKGWTGFDPLTEGYKAPAMMESEDVYENPNLEMDEKFTHDTDREVTSQNVNPMSPLGVRRYPTNL